MSNPIQYYGIAGNPDQKRVDLVLVTVVPGKPSTQEVVETFRTNTEALDAMRTRNGF
jgi:hypothetical protein